MRNTEQKMGMREHRMMAEHGNGGRTGTEHKWWQNTECQTTLAALINSRDVSFMLVCCSARMCVFFNFS
jgi:hypothetical protein